MVFGPEQIERFVADGFVVLREAFPQEVAAEGRAFLLRLLDLPDDTPADATDVAGIAQRLSDGRIPAAAHGQPMVHVQHAFGGPPFDRVMTPRLRDGLEQLMGPGRGVVYERFGWWPVLFPGFPGPGGWHVDSIPRHTLTAQERGLVTVFLFSDVGPGDGGTPFVSGSHATIAHQIAAAGPDGLSNEDLMAALPPIDPASIVSLEGRAGDAALLHPFLIHGFGPNRSRRLRFACNPAYPLHAPMELERPDGDYSPVEAAIRRALGA